jgi:glycosyltransferase involved in cell wall biosynthesis
VQQTYHVLPGKLAYAPLCPRLTVSKWSQHNTPEQPGSLLFFGRALPHKGLQYLLQALPLVARQVPNSRLLISVHGRDLEAYRPWLSDTSRLEIRQGYLPGEQMAALYERACLVTLPYISASTSGVLLDAYSFGKPVVASRVGCLPEYVIDGTTGLLVAPQDVEGLAEAVTYLLLDERIRKKMGANALEWSRTLEQHVLATVLEAYGKAIALKNGNRK